MDKRTIQRIINSNALFVQSDGSKGKCGSLAGLDLTNYEFNGKDLSGVNFTGAILRYADFSNCILVGTNFTNADMRNASFNGADLSQADFNSANLESVDFCKANLSEASFDSAKLLGADLRHTNCTGTYFGMANLENAYLTHAILDNADLSGTTLKNTTLPKYKICPEKGQFHAWKKVETSFGQGIILELLISGERTSSLVGRKCRCSKAKVLAACTLVGGVVTTTKFRSIRTSQFIYEVGKWVEEPNYDGDIRVECTKGIHFFMERSEAVEYV